MEDQYLPLYDQDRRFVLAECLASAYIQVCCEEAYALAVKRNPAIIDPAAGETWFDAALGMFTRDFEPKLFNAFQSGELRIFDLDTDDLASTLFAPAGTLTPLERQMVSRIALSSWLVTQGMARVAVDGFALFLDGPCFDSKHTYGPRSESPSVAELETPQSIKERGSEAPPPSGAFWYADPPPRLSRELLSEYMTRRLGYPIAVTTLDTLASKGGGPPFQYSKGGKPLYPVEEAKRWVEEQMSPLVTTARQAGRSRRRRPGVE